MKPGKKIDIAKVFEAGTPIDSALRLAAKDAFLCHKRAGRPVVIWQDGRILRVKPDTLLSQGRKHKARLRR